MRHVTLTALILLGTVAGAGEGTVPLGPDPVMAGGVFNRGGGGVTVAAELRETGDGQMAVCGVWARSIRLNARASVGARNTLEPAMLHVNGRQVRRDLRIFPQVEAAVSYAGAPARCVATGLAWDPDARLEITVPRQIVSNDAPGPGIGFTLILNRTDEANPALRSGSVIPDSLRGIIPGLGG